MTTQAGDQGLRGQLDRLLQAAADRRDVPGVVALAADKAGIIYEGAFGRRALPDDAPMTTDSVFWIASMTKAVTAVAAMQLIEQGRIALDQPAGELVAALAAPQVLDGFDADGHPILRPARRAITVRHLLTHTAGFSYDTWHPALRRYVAVTGLPSPGSGRLAALDAPLIAEPGEGWAYSIAIDWIGRIVEAVSGQTLDAYMEAHIFAPLGMRDTGYRLQPGQAERLAVMHRRDPDGTLRAAARNVVENPEFFAGGGGLHSTGRDYLRFLQMLLLGGRLGDAVVLQPATVALMGQNHTGALPSVGILRTSNPEMSHDLDAFPGIATHWGLSFLINAADTPTGRSAGSLTWAGLGNTYFWVDPARGVAGVLLTQILPFADPTVLECCVHSNARSMRRSPGEAVASRQVTARQVTSATAP